MVRRELGKVEQIKIEARIDSVPIVEALGPRRDILAGRKASNYPEAPRFY